MKTSSRHDPARTLFEAHPRGFQNNRYVYPVLSRRSGGISIGVNLSLDKACNFNCIYCQVDRTDSGLPVPGEGGEKGALDLGRLTEELDRTIELVTSGRIYQETNFRDTPRSLRRLSDIALSGDGEPTRCAQFDEVVSACVEVHHRRRLDPRPPSAGTAKPLRASHCVKLVLITNASMFHRAAVRRAMEMLDANHGEIWAKLDAGTEAFFRKVARSAVPWRRILDNLREAAKVRPIVIQSLLVRTDGEPPRPAELEAYCDRLGEILAAGGWIKLVQLHTIARPPAESCVTALSHAEVVGIAELVRRRTGLPVATCYGSFWGQSFISH